jgi:HAMP domain-containing protein
LKKEKIQIKLIIVGVSVPLVGGIITQIIPVILGFKMIPLTSTLTTFTAVIVAYGMVKHELMASLSFNIRRKIIAGFLIVVMLVSTIGFFSIAQSQEFLQRSIGEGSRLLARESIDKIDSVIYHRIEEIQLQAHSSNSRFQDFVKKSNQEFSTLGSEQEIYNYIVEKDIEWISTPKNETTYFMEDLLNNNISKNLMKNLEFYEELYNYSLFGEIFVTNKYGANIGLTGKTSDYYQADEEWWQNGKKDGLRVNDVNYDESADIYSIDIIVRIDDENGDFIGILKAVWNVEEITHILENSLLSEGNEQYSKMNYKLLNKDGMVVYSSKKFEFLEDDSNLLTHIYEYSVEKNEYFIMSDAEYGEGEKLVAYAHSERTMDFNDLNWILTLEYDIEDVFAPVVYLQNLILLASCIIATIGLLFGFFIAHSLSKPIVDLKSIVHKMGEGNLDVKIDVKSNDEIGDLAFNFKLMAKSLKNNQENLENQIAERTKELDNKIKELERFKELTVGRELKMIEIKKQMKELKTKLPERDKWI